MRAFTLIEIMVASLILTVIIGGVFGVLKVADMVWNQDSGLLDLQQQARQSAAGMARELRQARTDDITISNSCATIQFVIPTDITSSPVTYSDSISYYLSNGQLIREHPAGTTHVMGNDISSINFCCWHGAVCDEDCSDSSLLQIDLTASKTVRDRVLNFPLTGALTEKVRLRNE
jgi:prepilin-type N-terminal cleavage/methylation domain-containing protein